MKAYINTTAASLGLALALIGASDLKANLNFRVDIDTASLAGAANGPFFLDFQLNEGSGSLTNAVTLSDFVFDGGSATGTASTWGNASGSLSNNIWLSDDPTSPFNEIFQGFSAGTTGIHFEASITQQIPGATPDGFFVSILDSENNFPQIDTDAPDGVSLVALNINSSNTISDLGAYSSTSPLGVVASVGTPVPEASTMGMVFGGFALGLAGLRRFGRRSRVSVVE